MLLHNAHVLLWFRWRIWVARQRVVLLLETVLVDRHNDELARTVADEK